jgi:ribonuclease Z
MKSVSRILVALAALLFAVTGVQFWVVPEQAAQLFGIEAVRSIGLATVRADLGGLFLGLALLCGAAAWTKRRAGVLAASVVLAAIVVGRVIGVVVDPRAEFGVRELAVELATLVALFVYARSLGPQHDAEPRGTHRPLQIALGTLALLAVVASGCLMTPSVQQSIFDAAAKKLVAQSNEAPFVDDALRIAIAGTSAPLPSRARAKAAVVVFAGGKFWVVDTGPESTETLMLWGLPMGRIQGVLLTHFHSDHIGDLGELQLQSWAGSRPAPLAVYGGPGIERVVAGFNEAYAQDQGYRTEHHGEKIMPSKTWGMVAHTVALDGPPTPAKDRTALVYDDGALKITAIEVNHNPIEPAYAYRFDYKGRSVVVTGDMKRHEPIVKSAKDVDVYVSEALSRSMTRSLENASKAIGRANTSAIMHDIQDYHISPEEAAQLANEANARLLVYYHLAPAPDGFLARRLFANGVNAVRRGDWDIADDGSLYTLPIGSKEVTIGRMSSQM